MRFVYQLSITLEESDARKLRELADSSGHSMTTIARRLIRYGLKNPGQSLQDAE